MRELTSEAIAPPARALLTADAVGGVFTHALDLTRGLSARGVEVTLALLGPEMSQDRGRAASLAGAARVIETGLPLEWRAREPAMIRLAAQALAALAARTRAEIVQLHNPAYAVAAYPAPVAATLHSCVSTWWRAVRGEAPPPEAFRWRRQLIAEGLERVAAAAAPSRAFAAEAARVHGGARLTPVLNGRDPAPRPKRNGPRAGVLASGRWWDEGKGGALLDAAAARLDFPVEAAGPAQGPDGQTFQPQALRMIGDLPNPALLRRLGRRSVYVSPALYEPFGLGALEAAQAGCALVLSDIPTFRELWDGAARFVDPRQPEAVAAALRDLVADPAHAARLGAAARARAERFDVAAMTEATLRLWAEAAGRGRRAA
jgi:glycosyltransferase involved in cell wall biosynthesis